LSDKDVEVEQEKLDRKRRAQTIEAALDPYTPASQMGDKE